MQVLFLRLFFTVRKGSKAAFLRADKSYALSPYSFYTSILRDIFIKISSPLPNNPHINSYFHERHNGASMNSNEMLLLALEGRKVLFNSVAKPL